MQTPQLNRPQSPAPFTPDEWLAALDPYLVRLNEPDLSAKAAGIMLKLVFSPQFTINNVVERCSDGRTAVRHGLNELVEAGLVARSFDGDGRQQWENLLWQQCTAGVGVK